MTHTTTCPRRPSRAYDVLYHWQDRNWIGIGFVVYHTTDIGLNWTRVTIQVLGYKLGAELTASRGVLGGSWRPLGIFLCHDVRYTNMMCTIALQNHNFAFLRRVAYWFHANALESFLSVLVIKRIFAVFVSTSRWSESKGRSWCHRFGTVAFPIFAEELAGPLELITCRNSVFSSKARRSTRCCLTLRLLPLRVIRRSGQPPLGI